MRQLLLLLFITSITAFSQSEAIVEIHSLKGFGKYQLNKKIVLEKSFSKSDLYKSDEKEKLVGYMYNRLAEKDENFYGINLSSLNLYTDKKSKIKKIGLWFQNNYSRKKNDENLEALKNLLGEYIKTTLYESTDLNKFFLKWEYNKMIILAYYFDSAVAESGMLSIHIYNKKSEKKKKKKKKID